MMRFHTTFTSGTYSEDRYQTLKDQEKDIPFAYVDPIGIPSIGIGINLRFHGELVLEALGFDLDGQWLTGAAYLAEKGYANELLAAFKTGYGKKDTNANNAAKLAFDKILDRRAKNSIYASAPVDFPFRLKKFDLSLTTITTRVLFDEAVTQYIKPGTTNEVVRGAEAVPSDSLGFVMTESKERLALMSLGYSAQVLIGL